LEAIEMWFWRRMMKSKSVVQETNDERGLIKEIRRILSMFMEHMRSRHFEQIIREQTI
jgi:hypothetical protein